MQNQNIIAALIAFLGTMGFVVTRRKPNRLPSPLPRPSPTPIALPDKLPPPFWARPTPPIPLPSPIVRPIAPSPIAPSPIVPSPIPIVPSPRPIVPSPIAPSPRPIVPSPIVPSPRPIVPSPIQPGSCGMSYGGFANEPVPYIIGGYFARLGQFPWMVSLGGCGGSLIHPQWVISAAHCTQTTLGKAIYFGKLNKNINEPSAQVRTIAAIYDHPQYRGGVNGFLDDIRVMRLESPVQLNNYVNTVCLGNFPVNGLNLISSGWGSTTGDLNDSSSVLKFNYTKETGCYAQQNVKQICTTAVAGDICFGDSGGPLVTVSNGKNYLVGVTSSTISPYCSGKAKYTRISNYLPWIRQYVPGV
jgi:V8-like Glu-specific endopeptidase